MEPQKKLFKNNSDKSNLKKNRFSFSVFFSFFKLLKEHTKELLLLNLIYFIFLIPALWWTELNLQVILHLQNKIDSFFLIYIIVLIPFLMLAGPATTGITYIVKNLIKNKPVMLWNDFIQQSKRYLKSSMSLMLINGMALLTFFIAIQYSAAKSSQNVIFFILQNLILIFAVIYTMMNIFTFPILITFELPVQKILKNAFVFTIIRLPLNFVILLITLVPFFILRLVVPGWLFILIYLTFGFSFTSVLLNIYVEKVFDKYLKLDSLDRKSARKLKKENKDRLLIKKG